MRVLDNRVLASKWHTLTVALLTALTIIIYSRRGLYMALIFSVYPLMVFFYSRGYVKQFNAKVGR